MNERDLTDDDKKTIKAQQDNSPVVRFLRTKNDFNFSVGDYLIKMHKRGDRWEAETISHISSQPKRFICIHEDEYGIKYIKPLTSLGKELPYITQLTEVNDWTRYEVDPEFAEHIILDGESNFDFSEKRKQDKARREAITRKNKKIAFKTYKVEEIDAILNGLKPGDKFWNSYSIPECASSPPLIFVGVKTEKPGVYMSQRPITLKVEFKHQDPQHKNSVFFISEELLGRVIMLTEPFKYETV